MVQARMDNMGNIYARPVADRWAKRFAAFTPHPDDLEAFFQQGMGADEFLDDMPKRHRKALAEGYSVRWRMDGWEVGHWYGYDAHTAAEGGAA